MVYIIIINPCNTLTWRENVNTECSLQPQSTTYSVTGLNPSTSILQSATEANYCSQLLTPSLQPGKNFACVCWEPVLSFTFFYGIHCLEWNRLDKWIGKARALLWRVGQWSWQCTCYASHSRATVTCYHVVPVDLQKISQSKDKENCPTEVCSI